MAVLICLVNSFCPSLAISKSLEPVTSQLSNSVAAKMTAVEVALKDNVSKVVKSKASVRPRLTVAAATFSCHSHPEPLAIYRTRRTPSVGRQPKRCRGPFRQRTRTPSRVLCSPCLREAASPCSNKSTTALNKAHRNVSQA